MRIIEAFFLFSDCRWPERGAEHNPDSCTCFRGLFVLVLTRIAETGCGVWAWQGVALPLHE